MLAIVKSAVIPSLRLDIVDGKSYTVEFPLSSIIQAEKQTGLSLKSADMWLHLPTEHVPHILRAGLLKHHPDVTEEDVQAICDRLNPEALDEVMYALCRLAFPRFIARLEEDIKKRRDKGDTSPNVPSGAGL